MDPDMQALVLDIGSGMCKCGFSGDDSPRAVFPSIIGRPKNPGIMVGMDAKDCFIGDEAQAKRGILNLSWPVERGTILNWNDYEKIIHHAFYNELRVTPEEHPILLSTVMGPNKYQMEKQCSILFETFNIPGLMFSSCGELAMYSSGRTTGVVLDCGHGSTTVTPVYEGYVMRKGCLRVDFGGTSITEYLSDLMQGRGYEMISSAEMEVVRDIKEKLCYVSLSFDSEMRKYEQEYHGEHKYELPDGSKITLGKERIQSTEILFNPNEITHGDWCGIADMTFKSISVQDSNVRRDLYKNIVLSGGTTMFEGIVERMSDEIRKLAPRSHLKKHYPNEVTLKVNSPCDRKFSVWNGGSILSSLSTAQNMFISKDDFDDCGATICHKFKVGAVGLGYRRSFDRLENKIRDLKKRLKSLDDVSKRSIEREKRMHLRNMNTKTNQIQSLEKVLRELNGQLVEKKRHDSKRERERERERKLRELKMLRQRRKEKREREEMEEKRKAEEKRREQELKKKEILEAERQRKVEAEKRRKLEAERQRVAYKKLQFDAYERQVEQRREEELKKKEKLEAERQRKLEAEKQVEEMKMEKLEAERKGNEERTRILKEEKKVKEEMKKKTVGETTWNTESVLEIPKDEIKKCKDEEGEDHLLGIGGFGEVYKCTYVGSLQGQFVAVKEIKISVNKSQEIIQKEVQLVKMLAHPLVIKVYGYVKINKFKIGIVLEFMENGSLSDVIENNKERSFRNFQKWMLVRKMIKCVHYLHSKNIIHRDIKPQNFLLSKNKQELRISDFGLSKMKSMCTKTTSVKGTVKYIAPELFSMSPRYSESSDVYALGYTILFCVGEGDPFKDIDDNIIIGMKMAGRLMPKFPDEIPEEFRMIIMMCIDNDPSKRKSTRDLLDFMDGKEKSFISKYPAIQTEQMRALYNLQSYFSCPITCELLVDPVTLVETQIVYERSAITKWFEIRNSCPVTGLELKSKKLIENLILRNAIKQWKKSKK